MSDEFVQQILHQNIKHDTVYDHYDPSFDYGYQDATQRLVLMQPDGVVSFAENLINHPAYEDPKYVNNDTSPYTAEQLSQDSFDGWWSSTTGHKENMLWDYGTDDVYFGYANEWSTGLSITFGYNAAWAGQQFYNFTVPPPTIGYNEMERTWTNEYSIAGAEIIEFHSQYSIAAWQDVKQDITLTYAIRVARQVELRYGSLVASQVELPMHYGVSNQVNMPYTSLDPIANQITLPYALNPYTVANQVELPYFVQVSGSVSLPYGDSLQAIAQISLPYSIHAPVATQVTLPYASISPIAAQTSFPYSILNYNPVASSIRLWYSLLNQGVFTSTEDIIVTIGGVQLSVLNAEVAIKEEDFVWRTSLSMKSISDYHLFIQDAAFTVTIDTDVYHFVVEERSINRQSGVNIIFTIVGLSPAIKFKIPRADPIDFELTTSAMASDVVESILGEPVTWNVLDWMIPAYRVSATDISPIKLVKQITGVIGAMPESLLDGSLQIRYKWKEDTDKYALAVLDQTYTDVQDNVSATEKTQPFDLFNKFRIREGSDVFSDRIEYFNNDDVDDNDLAGLLRAYPDPWRLTVQVIQTNNPPLTLNAQGVVQRVEEQLVEFKEGKGTVSYPIVSVDSIVWKSYNLGILVNDNHGTELTAPTTVADGYGLAEITYTTEAITYSTSTPIPTDAQFLLEDIG